MKKVIFSYIEPDKKIEIPQFLKKNYGWEPVVFSFNSSVKKGMKNFFPDALVADEGKLRANIFDYHGLKKKPIDAEIIKKLKPYEGNFLSMIKEAHPGALSFFERRNFYYEILNYWNSVIHDKKPDLYLSYTAPHNEATYPLYLMCKYIHSIPLVFLEDYCFFDKYYTYNNNLNNSSLIFKNYERKNISEISDVVKNYFTNFKKKPTPPSYLKDFLEYMSDQKKTIQLIKVFFKEVFIVLKNIIKPRQSFNNNSYYKMNRKKNIMYITAAHAFYYEKIFAIKSYFNEKFYENIAQKKIPTNNFIFFAPSVQPEYYGNLRTGIFEDHILILELLIENLPADWTVVYKEHPFQFSERFGSLNKDKMFYKKIKKMKRVNILSQSINTYELIKKSTAVACSGSTVGMDAMMLGKPCLVFGNTWYNSCKSSINIKN